MRIFQPWWKIEKRHTPYRHNQSTIIVGDSKTVSTTFSQVRSFGSLPWPSDFWRLCHIYKKIWPIPILSIKENLRNFGYNVLRAESTNRDMYRSIQIFLEMVYGKYGPQALIGCSLSITIFLFLVKWWLLSPIVLKNMTHWFYEFPHLTIHVS